MYILGSMLLARWRNPQALQRLREKKLRQLIQHAYRYVPYYRTLFDDTGLSPGDIRTLDDITRIPISTKKDLQAAGVDAITSSAFPPAALYSSKTSGSSGRPFTIHHEARWVRVRNAMFQRALMASGFHPGRKAVYLRSSGKQAAWWERARYLSYRQPPDRLLAEINLYGPWLLYGWVTPLRQLAEFIQQSGAEVVSPQAVVTTAETLDGGTRRLIESAFDTRVFEIFGLTEMGSVAWECQAHNGVHIAEDTAILETVPSAGAAERLVMTNLDLFAMPFIRYDPGDLGSFAAADPCPCGRTFARLERIEGRLVDCVHLADGRVISPFDLTMALEKVAGLDRYQIIQEGLDCFTVRFEGLAAGAAEQAAVRNAITAIVGDAVTVTVKHQECLDPPPGQLRKFKVVECRVRA
jgi:phenylacetate-CoA ligase